MDSTQMTVWLLWDFGVTGTDPPALRAIDTSRELAQEHRDFLQKRATTGLHTHDSPRHYEIERRSTNHLFGKGCLANLDKLKGRVYKP